MHNNYNNNYIKPFLQALLTAYDSALDNIEANTILTHISFMERVRIGFVIGMEERLNHPSSDKILSDQFLLVFGSLAMKGTTEVDDRVINYLKGRVSALTIKTDEADLSDVILLLHALGNTGSKSSISLVFSILNASIEHNSYDKIELGVIEALSKVTDDPLVLTKLEQLLEQAGRPRIHQHYHSTFHSVLPGQCCCIH